MELKKVDWDKWDAKPLDDLESFKEYDGIFTKVEMSETLFNIMMKNKSVDKFVEERNIDIKSNKSLLPINVVKDEDWVYKDFFISFS